MKQSLVIVSVLSAFLIISAFDIGGIDLVLAGITLSVNTAIRSALLILQLNVLLTKDVIEKWLQKFKGIKAVIIGALAGGLFPGGPYIYYPFIASFKDKNLPFYVFISFVFGKEIYDVTRLPMEASLVSLRIALIRYLITLPIPIVVGKWHKQQ